MSRLTIICGLPGSGKSTWAERQYCRVVSADAIRIELAGTLREFWRRAADPESGLRGRVWQIYYERIAAELAYPSRVIADATNLRPEDRFRLLDVAWAYMSRSGPGMLAEAEAPRTERPLPIDLVVFANWQQACERNAARPPETRVSDEIMATFLARALAMRPLTEGGIRSLRMEGLQRPPGRPQIGYDAVTVIESFEAS